MIPPYCALSGKVIESKKAAQPVMAAPAIISSGNQVEYACCGKNIHMKPEAPPEINNRRIKYGKSDRIQAGLIFPVETKFDILLNIEPPVAGLEEKKAFILLATGYLFFSRRALDTMPSRMG